MINTENLKFLGMAEALNDAKAHLNDQAEKALVHADALFQSTSEEELASQQESSDREIARAVASDYIDLIRNKEEVETEEE